MDGKAIDERFFRTRTSREAFIDIARQRGIGLIIKTVQGRIRPVMALARPPTATVKQSSANSPTREFMGRPVGLERSPGILGASMVMGFEYADSQESLLILCAQRILLED